MVHSSTPRSRGSKSNMGILSSTADTIASRETTRVIMRSRGIGGNSRSDGVGRCEVEPVLGTRPSRTHFQIDSPLTTMVRRRAGGLRMC